jgi:hypothetical protein
VIGDEYIDDHLWRGGFQIFVFGDRQEDFHTKGHLRGQKKDVHQGGWY